MNSIYPLSQPTSHPSTCDLSKFDTNTNFNPPLGSSLQARGRTIYQQVRQPCLESKRNGSFSEAIHNIGSSRNHVELASLLKVGVSGIHRFLCLRRDLVSILNNAYVLGVRSFLCLDISLACISNVGVLGVRGFPCRRIGLVRLRLGLKVAPSSGAYGLLFVDNTTWTAVSLPYEGSDDRDHGTAVDDVHDDTRSPEDVAARWWDRRHAG